MATVEFGIYAVSVGAGEVALSPVPGRFGTYEADLSQILRWAPDLVLTMTGASELDRVGASGFGTDLAAVGVEWVHLPVTDFGAPDRDVAARWSTVAPRAAELLSRGGKVLCHCFGGCGRSGMMALRLMVEAGEAPRDALHRLRAVRPCAVETDGQFDWAAKGG